jgi:hypothetical protein
MHGEGGLIFLLVTHRKDDLHANYTDFPHFTENKHALEIKAALGLDPMVKFVTVAGAYTKWGIGQGDTARVDSSCVEYSCP